MDESLLPCPFCGNEAEFKPYKRDGLTLKCKSLGCVKFDQRTLRQSLDWLQGKMVEHWNSRWQAARSLTERSEWQPIETAPKDGTVLLLVPTLRAKWNAALPLAGMWLGFWTIFNADEAAQRVYPTHWRELPPPPLASSPSGKPGGEG